jgi:GTP-dependent dephospho-CoA kinase
LKAYFLPDDMREELRQPLGILIREEPPASIKRLQTLLQTFSPPVIIAVGDVVAKNLVASDIDAKILIVDGKTRRTEVVGAGRFPGFYRLQLTNPRAHITEAAWEKIGAALASPKRSVIEVRGEEDLLSIPAILLVPEGSFVVYGLPGEGMVVVRCDVEAKTHVSSLLARFHSVEIQEIR